MTLILLFTFGNGPYRFFHSSTVLRSCVVDKGQMDFGGWEKRFSRELNGDLGISAPWSWGGGFNQAATYRDIHSLLMDAYLDPGFYGTYMETVTDLIVEYNSVLADTEFSCIGIQGNTANSAIVGPAFSTNIFCPMSRRLIPKNISDQEADSLGAG